MNERDCSIEALISAEEQDLLKLWGFEQAAYSVVREDHNPAVMQKVDSVLKSDCSRSKNVVYSLVDMLAEEAKTTEELAYELGFGTRLPLFRPYVQMALEAGLIERVASAEESQEYWKIEK